MFAKISRIMPQFARPVWNLTYKLHWWALLPKKLKRFDFLIHQEICQRLPCEDDEATWEAMLGFSECHWPTELGSTWRCCLSGRGSSVAWIGKKDEFCQGGVLKIWVKAVSKIFVGWSSFSMIFWMKQFQICLLMRGFKDFLLALFAHDLCFVVLSLKLGFWEIRCRHLAFPSLPVIPFEDRCPRTHIHTSF